MRTLKLLSAAFAIAILAGPVPAAPQVAPWLVAQSERPRPSCDLDGRQVPAGTTYCHDGKVRLCDPNGRWVDTNKPC